MIHASAVMNEIVRSSTRLDSYVDRYAARTKGMTASEIRALFAVASRPEVVSLAGGMPNISGLPLDVVGEAIGDLIATNGPVALQYGSGQGDPTLREQITDVMRLEGIDAHPDDVVVTVGSQQAVDLVTRIFCDPGDVVLCEAPSYVGALGVFKSFQCDVVHVEMDAGGLVPEALRQAIVAVKAAGKTIKFLYTIPNFHNPAGVTLSAKRRLEILDICRERRHPRSRGQPLRPARLRPGADAGDARRRGRGRDLPRLLLQDLLPRDAGRLGAGPARRTREARARPGVRDPVPTVVQPDGRVGVPRQARLARPDQADARDVSRAARRDDGGARTTSCPPSCAWNTPAGGFFVWVTLPPGIDAKAMLPRAVTARVAYVPGTAFFADGFGSSSMRLSFCYPTPERIREGVRRLAGVLEAEMELRETFGALKPHPELAPRSGYDSPGTDLT